MAAVRVKDLCIVVKAGGKVIGTVSGRTPSVLLLEELLAETARTDLDEGGLDDIHQDDEELAE